MKKKYITFKYVGEISSDDCLNSKAVEDFIGKDAYETNKHQTIYIHSDGSWERESARMNIDDIISVLNDLKKKGANYAEIMYHTDHDGYEFNGVQVRESTKDEITVFESAESKKKAIEKELDKIEKDRVKLIKEYRKI
jgi:hypothetical protein